MTFHDLITKYLGLFLPLLIIQLVLMVVALVDLYKRKHVTGGRKWIWVPVIIFINMIGPIIYLTFGRKDA